MNIKAEIAQSLYSNMLKFKDENMWDESTFAQALNISKSTFTLTEPELEGTDPKFKEFIKNNGFLISSISKYGITEPMEDFNYNIERLQSYIKFSSYALYMLYYIAEGNFEQTLEDLDLSSDDYDLKDFGDELNIYKSEILYEQSLISIITLFEAFINNMLKWIFNNVEESRKNLKVNITYEEILDNYETILEIIVNKQLDDIRSWNDRIVFLNRKPTNIDLKKQENYNVINEAIEYRNLLIHHKGIVNEKFLSKIINKHYIFGERIKINDEYFKKVETAIIETAKFIDKQLREKYT